MQLRAAILDTTTHVAEAPGDHATDRLPWPQAGRLIVGLSLLGWSVIVALLLPVLG